MERIITISPAPEQIHEKDYPGRFGVDPRTVFLIAANFSTKTRTLTKPWLIETIDKHLKSVI